MAAQGVLLQPQDSVLVEVANDDSSDVTVIESDGDTDATEIDSDNQSDEDESLEDGEHRDDNEEHATQGDNHEITEGRIAFNDGLLRRIATKPEMLQKRLSGADLKHLDMMTSQYKTGGCIGTHVEQKDWQDLLRTISFIALLAENEGIWGPFVVVALDPSLHRWVKDIHALVPRFKVQSYWGTAADRKLLRKFWDLKSSIYTEDSTFHICVTSYKLVLSDAAYFQKMRWQFTILDDEKAIKSTKVSKIKGILGSWRSKGSFQESGGSQVDELNTNQNKEHPLDTEGVRKWKAHSSRRSHERVDGLEHLCRFSAGVHSLSTELIRSLVPAPPAVEGNDTDEMQPLHGLAFCLIRLNIDILGARDSSHRRRDFNFFGAQESGHMDGLVTAGECKEGYQIPGSLMDGAQQTRLAEYVKTYSREQIIQRIRDPKALPYLLRIFEHRLMHSGGWRGQIRMVENDPTFVLPANHKEKVKADYAYECMLQYRLSRHILRDLYSTTLQLREYAITACSSHLLDDISLRQLKAKMTALQPGFQEACGELGLPREMLVWDSQTWW
jgi:hypothetical protein